MVHVQELVPDSLLITDWVKRESPPLRKLVGTFVELAKLCGVMASKGIRHRDLKPGNILVTPEGTPKVIDFESESNGRGKKTSFHRWGDVFSMGLVPAVGAGYRAAARHPTSAR